MKIKFVPQNVEIEATSDKSILTLAQENNIHIKSVCKGVPSCAECRINILEGETNVLPPSTAELGLIGSSYFVDNRRLACQLYCFGDMVIDMKEQLEKADRAVGTKRPHGVAKGEYDPKESRAVMGNIIHEDAQNKADAQERKANRRIFEEEKQRLLKMLREQRAEKERVKKDSGANSPEPAIGTNNTGDGRKTD